jgi:hypothetical protein
VEWSHGKGSKTGLTHLQVWQPLLTLGAERRFLFKVLFVSVSAMAARSAALEYQWSAWLGRKSTQCLIEMGYFRGLVS